MSRERQSAGHRVQDVQKEIACLPPEAECPWRDSLPATGGRMSRERLGARYPERDSLQATRGKMSRERQYAGNQGQHVKESTADHHG